ncbi:RMV1 [Symbiodinium microadriaticum]|nr:RMV1 [Symbiodinium microadriaticum]
MRLPYPGAFKSGWSDTAYDSEENALQKTVNLAVLLLNWLALGRPKHAPPELSLLPPSTGAQRAVVRRFESMMREVVLHPVVAAEDMGRVAAKVEDLESLIASLTLRGDAVAARSRGYSVGGRKEPLFDPIEVEFAGAAGRNAGATTPAKPIVASRLKFGSPPSFCPKRFMDAETLDHYEHPFSYAIAEEALTEDPPKARVLAQHPEKLALFRKLDEGGRLRLVPASVTRKKCLNGMFAVPKNLTADRLILDARGPNLLEPGRTAWTQSLGTISAVLGISLKDDEILLMSGADLSDYYYHYVISEERVLRNALAGVLAPSEAKLFSCYCKELENKGTSEGAVRLRKMSAKYKETGLVQNMKKGFEEVTEASFWGGKVNGVAGTVRPLPERTLPVLSLTVDVIRCGYATKHLLATLAGFYISAFQFRRRFMSLLEEIFLAPSWMEDHCTFRIWPALEAELWCLVIATPMVRTNLRADYLNQISATDASDSFEAEVSTEVSAEFVEEVHRHSLRKSVWTRLLHPLSAQSREAGELPEDEELPGDERLEEHPLWGHVFRCLPFRTVWRKKIRRKRHINLHELRAVLISEERRALRHPHCKLVTGADSQVSLGALLKGRSSSSKLNGALRQSLPAYIGLDIHGGYLYVRSCDNPADDPTRSVPTRAPPFSMPRWLHDAVDGNFELLDDELVKCGMDPVSLLGLPPLENIVPVAEAPRPVPRAVRRRMWMRSLGGPAPSLTPGPDPEAFAASCLRGDAVTAEMVLSLLSLLPGEHAARGDSGARTKSWTTGVFVHGGAIGLRRHCLDFPLSTSMLTRYASLVVPTHQYSSLSLLQNLKTSVHKDAHNSWCHFNAVLPISSFSGGDIWSQVDGGPDKEEVRGHPYGGRNLKVSDGAVYLDPHKYHFTRAWRGLRVVMVLYTVRNIERLERNNLATARSLGFPVPSSDDTFAALEPCTASPVPETREGWTFDATRTSGSCWWLYVVYNIDGYCEPSLNLKVPQTRGGLPPRTEAGRYIFDECSDSPSGSFKFECSDSPSSGVTTMSLLPGRCLTASASSSAPNFSASPSEDTGGGLERGLATSSTSSASQST